MSSSEIFKYLSIICIFKFIHGFLAIDGIRTEKGVDVYMY